MSCTDPLTGEIVSDPSELFTSEDGSTPRVCLPEELSSRMPEPEPQPAPPPRRTRRSTSEMDGGTEMHGGGMDGGVAMDGGPPAPNPYDGMYDHLPPLPPLPVDIDAVDDRDFTGTMAAAVRANEVTGFDNAEEMVDEILEAAGEHPLRTVSVHDHGRPGSQQMGDQRVNLETLQDPETRAALERLGAHMAPNGQLDLHGCRVALGEEGEALLREMARVTNHPVRGGYPYQRPLIPGLEGSVMTCDPPVVDENGTESQECRVEGHPTMDAIWGTGDRPARDRAVAEPPAQCQ